MPICLVCWSFVPIFIICELGERLTDHFNEISIGIFQCDWYIFPIDVQKMFLIVLLNAQTPITIRGFGNLNCTRDKFKDVSSLNEKYLFKLHLLTIDFI